MKEIFDIKKDKMEFPQIKSKKSKNSKYATVNEEERGGSLMSVTVDRLALILSFYPILLINVPKLTCFWRHFLSARGNAYSN